MEGTLEIKLKQGGYKVSVWFIQQPLPPAGGCLLMGVSLLCDWLLQGPELWEEVFAVLEGGTLTLFRDQAAAAQVPA